MPEFQMRRGFIESKASGGSNWRAGFNTKAQIIGVIGVDPMAAAISRNTVHADGYDWHMVVIADKIGYVAFTENILIEWIDSDTPKPVPEPVPDMDALVQKYLADLFAPVMIDIPVPAFTMTIPDVLRQPFAAALRNQAKLLEVMAQRIEDPLSIADKDAA